MQKGRDLILVMGATGNQGQAVARELLGRGHRVRATTRRPDGEPARALAALGAEIVQAELPIPVARGAMAGAWAPSPCRTPGGGRAGEEEQGKRVAEVARKQGVSHFVYTSVGSRTAQPASRTSTTSGASSNACAGWDSLAHDPASGVLHGEPGSPWFKPAIDQGHVAIGMRPETRLQMIAVKDIGRYGALAFERHAELAERRSTSRAT